jgi:hypothetical protein
LVAGARGWGLGNGGGGCERNKNDWLSEAGVEGRRCVAWLLMSSAAVAGGAVVGGDGSSSSSPPGVAIGPHHHGSVEGERCSSAYGLCLPPPHGCPVASLAGVARCRRRGRNLPVPWPSGKGVHVQRSCAAARVLVWHCRASSREGGAQVDLDWASIQRTRKMGWCRWIRLFASCRLCSASFRSVSVASMLYFRAAVIVFGVAILPIDGHLCILLSVFLHLVVVHISMNL